MNHIEIENTKDPLDILEEKYPIVFKNMLNDSYNEIPAGWFNIVDKLCNDLTPLIEEELKNNCPEDGYPLTILQIKEKFGGLRFYFQTHGKNEVFHKSVQRLVDMAEDESYNVCCTTGKPGKLCRKGGYYQTMSEDVRLAQGFKIVGNGNT